MDEVFHSGEREIQQKVGDNLIANSGAKLIAETVIKGAINFIEKQPMAIVSSVNRTGQLWASLIMGDAGFAKVPQPNVILFDENMIQSTHEDIFYKNIQENSAIGSLFIELATRKRFRINGKASKTGSNIKIKIHEAYPNCPKYIQRRIVSSPQHVEKSISTVTQGNELSFAERNWIANADTFFVASSSNTGRLDVSHRGGNKGFVTLLDDDTLKIPDYQGNSFYNTLGNILHNPHVGILFINFEKRQTLQLTGKAKLLFDQRSELDIKRTNGKGRYWLFKTEEWIRTENHHQVKWEFLDYSPFNP